MSQPLQIWVPQFYRSPFSDFSLDLQRAYREWEGEEIVWLMPNLEKVVRWKTRYNDFITLECAVPSDRTNLLRIYHLDETRRMYPELPGLVSRFKNTIPRSLYKLWLKDYPKFGPGPPSIPFPQPVIKDNKFCGYKEIELKLAPGPVIPFDKIPKEGKISAKWPSQDKPMPRSVSPDEESKKYYGKLKFEKTEYSDINIASVEKELGGKVLHTVNMWHKPFEILFPDGGNLDLMYNYACMKKLIKNDEGLNNNQILKEAQDWLGKYVTDGRTNIEKAFFLPKAIRDKDALLIDTEARYGIQIESFEDLLKSQEFRKLISEEIEIKRIYSWLGYLWWEFYQGLSQGANMKLCENCGNIISGGRIDRKYCLEKENSKCFKDRAAKRQIKKYRKNN